VQHPLAPLVSSRQQQPPQAQPVQNPAVPFSGAVPYSDFDQPLTDPGAGYNPYLDPQQYQAFNPQQNPGYIQRNNGGYNNNGGYSNNGG